MRLTIDEKIRSSLIILPMFAHNLPSQKCNTIFKPLPCTKQCHYISPLQRWLTWGMCSSEFPRMSSPLISQSNSHPLTSSSSADLAGGQYSNKSLLIRVRTTLGQEGHCIMITTHTQTVKVWEQLHTTTDCSSTTALVASLPGFTEDPKEGKA